MAAMSNWLGSIHERVDFYSRGGSTRRRDRDFDWRWFDASPSGRFFAARKFVRRVLHRFGLGKTPPISLAWLDENADRLWDTRLQFDDDVSRLMFDEHLVLKLVGHRKHFFPRTDFDDLLTVLGEEEFRHAGLPTEYVGLPLKVFRVQAGDHGAAFSIITTRLQLDLLNGFRQYLPTRNGVELGPRPGDVVIDCGACIGEVSLVFATQVGPSGQVHLFDPVPLHTQFCRLQAGMNPAFAAVMRVNTLAVGDATAKADGRAVDAGRIEPNAVRPGEFDVTTLDDYCEAHAIDRIDFIKMDIEGSELSALDGAARTIARCKPRLAISAYHKPDDLWVLAARIKQLRPDYQLSFGHHSPIQWESVLYAS